METYNRTRDLDSAEERESQYSKCREAICETIRTSKNVIDRVIPGFFKVRDHLHLHFKYISGGVDDLRKRIEDNWIEEMSSMEKFVQSQDNKKKNFMKRLKEVDDLANLEYQGSRLLKDVHLLIIAGDILDKDGRGLFLLPKEQEPIVDGPFLRVIETQDRYKK